MDAVEYEDPPLDADVRAQRDMNLPWQLQFVWQDVVRVWKNMRTGETIGPKSDRHHTSMNRTVRYRDGQRVVAAAAAAAAPHCPPTPTPPRRSPCPPRADRHPDCRRELRRRTAV